MKAYILLVEDNENNRYLARFLLEREGHTVETAQDGRQALEMASARRPDMIVMDIQMPEMDGYEATARLRLMPELEGVPIVGVSSFAMSGDREKAIRAGLSGYIEKPIDPETFAARIRSFLPEPDKQP